MTSDEVFKAWEPVLQTCKKPKNLSCVSLKSTENLFLKKILYTGFDSKQDEVLFLNFI